MKIFKDRSVMSKTLGILIVLVLLSGAYACSKPGAPGAGYVGTWELRMGIEVDRIIISAAGNNQFSIFMKDYRGQAKVWDATIIDGFLVVKDGGMFSYEKKTDTLLLGTRSGVFLLEYKRIE